MTIIHYRDPSAIRPLHVVLLCLLVVVVGGGSLLLSAAESKTLIDGAIEWHAESPLRAVVQLLCLNYQCPTRHAGAVKIYLLGFGAGLAVLALSIAVAARGRDGEAQGVSNSPAKPDKAHVAPLLAAQLLVGLYLLWSFAGSRWSAAPELAVGGSILLTIQLLWAFGLGNGLNASAARIASRIVIIVVAVTSVIALWYFYGRNPVIRAKFPFGNPNFLSACLIPGLLLAITFICEKVGTANRVHLVKCVAAVVAGILVLAVGVWAFTLTGSRGPALGLWFGLLAVVFFRVPRWLKLGPVIVAVATVVAGWVYFISAQNQASPTSRDVTLRVRTYAWNYALQMFNERPFTGHGQGGFVLKGDTYAVDDVLNDPKPFEARIAHAHSEWLEILADLGSVGLVLLATGLILTLRAGVLALESLPAAGDRWALIGLMSALVGLVVEETFGVGLRVSGVGTLFYTVIGLIWAFSAHRIDGVVPWLSATTGRRTVTAVIGGVVGLTALVFTQQDFAAARATYRVREALFEGKHDEAIHLASIAKTRLNPQRALTNLYRLAEAHLHVARDLQQRAVDRETRGRGGDIPNARLLHLAAADYQASDDHCTAGSAALKELVRGSPGYFNHGHIEYLLNVTLAHSAGARGDDLLREQHLAAATAAIERELARQPFNPAITLDFVSVTATVLDLDRIMNVLARPLRHQGITRDYVALLRQLTGAPGFEAEFASVVEAAIAALQPAPPTESVETWAPEKLRIAATIEFVLGDYDRAREYLELAASACEPLASGAPLGAASCYAELADCRFYAEPDNPASAIEAARRAQDLAPESWDGRRLRQSVLLRMVDYHLAADEEQAATVLLRELDHADTTDEIILSKLAMRYRRMCESLLQRREAGVLRKPPETLLPNLRRWILRSIELYPDDAASQFLAADLAFQSGDDQEATEHLRRAVHLGLPVESAVQFLHVALAERPDSSVLRSLKNELQPIPPVGDTDPTTHLAPREGTPETADEQP